MVQVIKQWNKQQKKRVEITRSSFAPDCSCVEEKKHVNNCGKQTENVVAREISIVWSSTTHSVHINVVVLTKFVSD